MTDATHKGVSDGSQGDEIPNVRTQEEIDQQLREDMNPANRIRSDAARRFNESRRESLGIAAEESGDEGDGEEALSFAQESEPAQEEPVKKASAPGAPPLPVYLKDGEYYTKLKVDGREVEVPYSRAQATMQKHEAADRRLQHATELLRKAEEREREAQERASRLSKTVSQLPQDDGDEQDLDKQAHGIINKLLDGEADAAATELATILKGRRAPQIDQTALEERAAKRALSAIEQAEWAKDAHNGQQMFIEKYADVLSDPDLANIANQKTIQIMKEKPYLKPSEVMKEAGDYVMEKFLGGKREVQRTQPDPQREERKRNLRPIPRSVNTRQTPPPEKPAPTKHDWIAEQKRRRGQRY